MDKIRRALTGAEWAILESVWENEPCAAPTVQEAIEEEKKWTYSTVKTIMDRMVTKGLLSTEKIRNLMLYRSIISKAEAQKSEIMRAIRTAFNGALTPMMQFLLDSGELSEGQLDELEATIKKKRAGGQSEKKE